MVEVPGEEEVAVDPRPGLGLAGVAITFASASAMNVATVSDTRAALKARPHLPPIRGRPSARHRSSQTIARRSGSPAWSVMTTVPRWVVSATPAMASRRACGFAHRRWHASPIARQ